MLNSRDGYKYSSGDGKNVNGTNTNGPKKYPYHPKLMLKNVETVQHKPIDDVSRSQSFSLVTGLS